MAELLVRKLEHFEKLSEADKRVLQEATKDVREFAPHRDIISEGERPDYVHLLLEVQLGKLRHGLELVASASG